MPPTCELELYGAPGWTIVAFDMSQVARIGAAVEIRDTDKDGALSQNEINVAMQAVELFADGASEISPATRPRTRPKNWLV